MLPPAAIAEIIPEIDARWQASRLHRAFQKFFHLLLFRERDSRTRRRPLREPSAGRAIARGGRGTVGRHRAFRDRAYLREGRSISLTVWDKFMKHSVKGSGEFVELIAGLDL